MLRKSYDQLPTDEHRLMFLDVALMLNGRPVEHLTALWPASLSSINTERYVQPDIDQDQSKMFILADLCSLSLVSVDDVTRR